MFSSRARHGDGVEKKEGITKKMEENNHLERVGNACIWLKIVGEEKAKQTHAFALLYTHTHTTHNKDIFK